MKALITGGMGFVGRHLTPHLRNLGWEAIRLDRSPTAEWSAEIGDAKRLSELACTQEFDAVIHLAALLPSQGNDEAMRQVNIEGTRNILLHFVKPKTHLIFLSTGLVYGAECEQSTEETTPVPAHIYAQTKFAAETLVHKHCAVVNCKATVFRPSVLYGEDAPPNMFLRSLVEALRAKVPFAMTAGEQWRDFLHVEDACAAISMTLQKGLSGLYNLASGDVRKIVEVARMAGAVSGNGSLLQIGALPYRDGESFRYSLDASKLRKELSWVPHHSLSSFFRSQFP